MNYYNEEAMSQEYERDKERFINLTDPPAGMQAYMILSRFLAKYDMSLAESQCAWTSSPKGTLFRGTETFFLQATNGKNFTVGRRYCLYTCLTKGISVLGLRKGDYVGVFGDVPTSTIVVRTGRYFICTPYGKCKIRQWVVFAGFTENNELVTDMNTVIEWAEQISAGSRCPLTARRPTDGLVPGSLITRPFDQRITLDDPRASATVPAAAPVVAGEEKPPARKRVKRARKNHAQEVTQTTEIDQTQRMNVVDPEEALSGGVDYIKDFPASETVDQIPPPSAIDSQFVVPQDEPINKQPMPTPSAELHVMSPSNQTPDFKQNTPSTVMSFSPFPFFPFNTE